MKRKEMLEKIKHILHLNMISSYKHDELAEALLFTMENENADYPWKSEEKKYGYMCKTDWDWELGEASGGTPLYPNIKDLKKCRPCVENCGIVKVSVKIEGVCTKEYEDEEK